MAKAPGGGARSRRRKVGGVVTNAEWREVVEWLLPYATHPECICDKGTVGECDCNVEEAQRNYFPTLEKAQALLRSSDPDVA